MLDCCGTIQKRKQSLSEGGEEEKRPWPFSKWSYLACQMEEPVHWKQFHWKAVLHSGTIGCVEGYRENQNSVVPFLPLMVQMILNKASSNVGVCLISYGEKKKISTVVEKKIVSLQVSNHEDLSRIKLNNGRSNRRELLISGHMISSPWSHIQNNCPKGSRKMPFSREEPVLPTSPPRRAHKGCAGLFIQMIQQNSAATSLGSISSLLLGNAARMLLHLYESMNVFPFQYSWRQHGIMGIKSCLSTCTFNERSQWKLHRD